ncbi:endonuclease V [Streptomyces sp. AV19]|uniref:endonuclease V n=1 Tax=Streptomyces sp. AV19 TaxID=2793068 RepID=UPI0035AB9467
MHALRLRPFRQIHALTTTLTHAWLRSPTRPRGLAGQGPFTFRHAPPGPGRGDWSPLLDGDEEVGRALRTRAGVKPVFVSVGHRVGLDGACAHVLSLARDFRLPETTRRADALCRRALVEAVAGG